MAFEGVLVGEANKQLPTLELRRSRICLFHVIPDKAATFKITRLNSIVAPTRLASGEDTRPGTLCRR